MSAKNHHTPANMALWQGRIDDEEEGISWRWHQQVQALPTDYSEVQTGDVALLGFACDEGVRRNKGRQGAKQGPEAIRKALANAAWHLSKAVYDAGDVNCDDEQLEPVQAALGLQVAQLLRQGLQPIVLGGGHEIAWASFQGIAQHVYAQNPKAAVGIVNFDAHLDLRNPERQGSSGTPFRQIAEWCAHQHKPFHYYCIGVNDSANTQALFDFAKSQGVLWRLDHQCKLSDFSDIRAEMQTYLRQLDYLYLTICMDVFNAAAAPGVSAPSVMGLDPVIGLALIKLLISEAQALNLPIVLVDLAECNPLLDQDSRTAKLAARLVYEIAGAAQ
ncbi:formiminoglutamase [Oceanospirillum multiglobuliferum]|uniref:Formimidoylglutamase n=1 Tax=Oceanospirillum multiglobuliferum TaxID=64969 RepID=A0A1T4SAK7_9GAMM|nr:formimidoylglutamase [Oceanospirillum multiglobuliferum]OPX55004.1 formimidoylglutamase [Oceanospirillum multiglobuliferum]SKA25284.1 formiminoglutamase [Oceanospirillum multiglobuliferum]